MSFPILVFSAFMLTVMYVLKEINKPPPEERKTADKSKWFIVTSKGLADNANNMKLSLNEKESISSADDAPKEFNKPQPQKQETKKGKSKKLQNVDASAVNSKKSIVTSKGLAEDVSNINLSQDEKQLGSSANDVPKEINKPQPQKQKTKKGKSKKSQNVSEASTVKSKKSIVTSKGLAEDVSNIDLSQDEKKLLVSSADDVQKEVNKPQPQQRETEKAKSKKSQNVRGARAFQDKWLVATCKGHTGAVSDMNLSQNGKQLISCADDNLRDRRVSETSVSSRQMAADDGSGSDSTKETSAEEDQSPRTSKPLSRRQKKNRKTQEPSGGDAHHHGHHQHHHHQHHHHHHHQKKKQTSRKVEKKNCNNNDGGPLGLYTRLSSVGDEMKVLYLGSYVLSNEQRLNWGYPVVLGEGVFVFKADAEVRRRQPKTNFDVNAREFFPPTYSRDSDSGNSSESSSGDSRAPLQMMFRGEVYYINAESKAEEELAAVGDFTEGRKTCCRCSRFFYMTDDFEYVSKERCRYHYGKLSMNYPSNYGYSCCGGAEDSEGCTVAELHVWSGMSPGFNGPFHDFVHTKPRRCESAVKAYALDCEMSFTRFGLDVTKVTVVALDGSLVYDAMVRPEADIIDYNTRFSGVSEGDLRGVGVKRLREVQEDLLKFIHNDTILIGHGLENDLRALKIVHPTVIDTAIAYPHYNGLPFRRSLKQLTLCFLKREIQTGNDGHSSFEDARAAMELILYKYMMEFRNLLNFSC